jgi:hypothetical protein
VPRRDGQEKGVKTYLVTAVAALLLGCSQYDIKYGPAGKAVVTGCDHTRETPCRDS